MSVIIGQLPFAAVGGLIISPPLEADTLADTWAGLGLQSE